MARRLKLSPKVTDEGKVCHSIPLTGNRGKVTPHPTSGGISATFPQGGRHSASNLPLVIRHNFRQHAKVQHGTDNDDEDDGQNAERSGGGIDGIDLLGGGCGGGQTLAVKALTKPTSAGPMMDENLPKMSKKPKNSPLRDLSGMSLPNIERDSA